MMSHDLCLSLQYQQQHDERSDRSGRGFDESLAVSDSYNEIHHHRYSCEQYAARHSLTIEHQEERQVYQCRTRFLLCHDEEHRQQYDAAGSGEVAPAVYVETIGAHEFRHGKGSGKLGKLCRLQSQRTEHEPRPRAFDFVWVEYRGKEQQEQHHIYHVGEGVVELAVEHQQHEAQCYRSAYPYYLHAGAGTQ